jgi:type IV pilus assembly protein PilE
MAHFARKTTNPRPVRAGGFTLIEVIVVVTILAILAAIAIPSYAAYLARGYRSEARGTLISAAQWMERWRTETGTYQGAALPAGLSLSPPNGTQRYGIAVAVPNPITGQGYLLTATPVGSFAGDACGNLTLDNTGLRARTGTEGIDTCWGR